MVTSFSLIVATVSTIGLIALGGTTLYAAIVRMGAKGWNQLHNTVYLLIALALLHVLLAHLLEGAQPPWTRADVKVLATLAMVLPFHSDARSRLALGVPWLRAVTDPP